MVLVWSILSSVIASILTTLGLHFFLNRMTENAKKPVLTPEHQGIIDMLNHYNATATVHHPNGSDKNYDVLVTTHGKLPTSYFPAFDEMIDNKIVICLPTGTDVYRLAYNHMTKYRKSVWALIRQEARLLVGRV